MTRIAYSHCSLVIMLGHQSLGFLRHTQVRKQSSSVRWALEFENNLLEQAHAVRNRFVVLDQGFPARLQSIMNVWRKTHFEYLFGRGLKCRLDQGSIRKILLHSRVFFREQIRESRVGLMHLRRNPDQ